MIAHPQHGKEEKGSALLIVLGLVAVIAGWASSAAYEDMLSLRRAENSVVSNKAELACLSALALSKQGLIQDAKDSQIDSLDEQWAQSSPPFPVDNGLVAGSIEDANRYLNINDLITPQGNIDMTMLPVFQRLFTQLQLDPALLDALVDWMDADSIPFGYAGAEDDSYFDKPYRVKNAVLDRFQELRMIRGFDATTLQALKGSLRVWQRQSGAFSHVNVNTAQQSILLAMFPLMNDADVQTLMLNRPYQQLTTLQQATWAQGAKAQVMLSHLSVASDVFIVKTHAIFGRADRTEAFGLARQGTKLTWLWRERILWQAPLNPINKAGQP
ncbi:MAG: type II secretion system minor pseudopilin GspK [Mariprofundaceae bacterium]|nr:type II secretion system minor pseudopilin GspK [Mariprofundaceae bacterium]